MSIRRTQLLSSRVCPPSPTHQPTNQPTLHPNTPATLELLTHHQTSPLHSIRVGNDKWRLGINNIPTWDEAQKKRKKKETPALRSPSVEECEAPHRQQLLQGGFKTIKGWRECEIYTFRKSNPSESEWGMLGTAPSSSSSFSSGVFRVSARLRQLPCGAQQFFFPSYPKKIKNKKKKPILLEWDVVFQRMVKDFGGKNWKSSKITLRKTEVVGLESASVVTERQVEMFVSPRILHLFSGQKKREAGSLE